MTELIAFSIKKTTGANIPSDELINKYKIYCREVTSVDLQAKGGFALPGEMLKLHFSSHSASITTSASGKNPVVICVDKREGPRLSPVAKIAQPVSGRFGILLIPASIMKLNPVPIPGSTQVTVYDDIVVNASDTKNYIHVGFYFENEVRFTSETVKKFLEGSVAYNNPYTTIAYDLSRLVQSGAFSFAAEPVHVIPNIEKSLKPKDSVHGRFWLPSFYKFMGEIGGIVLTQPVLDPYGQPSFLAEVIIAHLDEMPSSTQEEMLNLIEDQKKRFQGMIAEFDIAASLLEARIKSGDIVCPNCHHYWSDHDEVLGGCQYDNCTCINYKKGNPFASL